MVTGASTTSLIMSSTGESGVKRSSSDNRRSNKPIMEKRRRARINNCLNELKTLILDATKKDPARHSKLEKADILEKTVKYLQDLQRQQTAMTQAADPAIVNKFKAGFTECAKEVDRFQGLEPLVKRRLLHHLSAHLSGVKSEHISAAQTSQLQPVQIHMLPSSPPGSPEQNSQSSTNGSSANTTTSSHHQQHQQILKLTNPSNGYYLTLPNGILTYVAPSPNKPTTTNTAMPTLVPIPSRTSSTASAASNTSSAYERLSARDSSSESPASSYSPPSPANSYEAMEFQNSSSSPISTSSASHNQQFHQHMHHRHSAFNGQSTPSLGQQHHDDSNHSMDEDDDEGHSSSGESIEEHRSAMSSPVPLSLVMKRSAEEDNEEQPWRPW